ncbi:HAMP domain-containing protein [Sulfurimonas aquatica]|uniref:histidine kinase n=1 Tax=Sulfurimonas aquatica TaxID=2672570 RepID=A0A975GCZ4_9BACT|nr:ATP-binding protein [Sulfurimonas aquatica]QSZ42037.1 HAMP domain-containing protein [Sulfurimonas aquatica]
MLDNLFHYYSNLSIAKKLRFTGIITAFFAGSFSIVLIFFYQYSNQKEFLKIETEVLGKIVAQNISSAVLFNDQEFMSTSLKSLIYQKRVKHAYVTDSKFNTMTSYHHSKEAVKEELLQRLSKSNNSLWDSQNLYIKIPISVDENIIGFLILVSSLNEFIESMIQEMLVIIFIVILAMIVSFKLRVRLIDSILIPIARLNESTHKIIQTKNLTTNVEIYNNDEIGELATNFNHMINTIQISNEKLIANNEELESRVNERTSELQELNLELDQRVKNELHKRLEQEQILIQQSRFAAMGEMIGNIAHQWRQPLNALGLLLQNLENAYEMEMLDKEYIDRTIEKGNRLTGTMSQTIDDFRNFFKPNKDSVTFTISSSLKSTLEMLRSSFDNSIISVHQDIDESVNIMGVPSEFSQVILNILNNAKDALVENRLDDRQLYIRVFDDENSAYLEIEDNAGGIPSELLEKIFDPYFTTKDEGKGTGIGLYMSKTIIENNMHGTLKVKNNKNGAIFSIQIKKSI